MQAAKSSAESAAPAADGITNVQTAGVDEGGIVKLRRKRWHAADENLAVDLNPARQTVE